MTLFLSRFIGPFIVCIKFFDIRCWTMVDWSGERFFENVYEKAREQCMCYEQFFAKYLVGHTYFDTPLLIMG